MDEKKIPKDCNSREVKFHVSERCHKNAKKAKHRITDSFDDVKKVLRNNPDYGPVIPGTNGLRKMRVRPPDLQAGKSGGYRLIYRKTVEEEITYIVLLAVFFKGDVEDLDKQEYVVLRTESESILDRLLEIPWQELPPVPST